MLKYNMIAMSSINPNTEFVASFVKEVDQMTQDGWKLNGAHVISVRTESSQNHAADIFFHHTITTYTQSLFKPTSVSAEQELKEEMIAFDWSLGGVGDRNDE